MNQETKPLRDEPGWIGHFTREQAPGAIPNGTPIIKVEAEDGDANPVGTRGKVLGSIRDPRVMDNALLYFLEWDSMPRTAVACIGWKIAADA